MNQSVSIPGEPVLIGSQIPTVVSELLALFHGSDFTCVSLVAGSGNGKSRIVRELYSRVHETQARPPYWPPLNVGEPAHPTGVLDPLARRKVLGPPRGRIQALPGALPDFLWLWLTAGEDGTGSPVRALPQLSDQLALHAGPVLAAALDRAPVGQRARDLTRALVQGLAGDARDEAVSNVAGQVVEVLAGASVPGLGVALQMGQRALDRNRRHREARSAVQAGYAAEINQADLARDVASEIADVARSGLPVVVAIEDAHHVDEQTVDMLLDLRDRGVPVLVIATVWPEGEDRPAYQRLAQAMTLSGAMIRRELEPMSETEIEELVAEQFPLTEPGISRVIARRFPTPLGTQLFLSLDVIRRNSSGGRLQLDADDISSLGSDIRWLYEARWRELTSEVQNSLVLAMSVTGAQDFTQESHGFIETFVSALVSDVADRREVSAHLRAANRDHWTVEAFPRLHQYLEPTLAELVLEKVRARYLSRELAAMADQVLSELLTWLEAFDIGAGVTTPESFAAQWALALMERLERPDDASSLKARFIHALHLASRLDYATAYPVSRQLVGELRETGSDLLAPCLQLAFRCAAASGAVSEAVALGQELVTRLRAAEQGLSQDSIAALLDLGYWLRNAGDSASAVKLYEDLLVELRDYPDDPLAVTLTKAGLAAAVGSEGDPHRACAILQPLVAASAADLGPLHLSTLVLRRNLARWEGASGRLLAACTGLEAVLADMRVVIGPRHPETLFALSNLAYFEAERGEIPKAVSLYEDLVQLRREVLGTSHPHTIDSVRNLVRAQAKQDLPGAAVDRLHSLLESTLASLGSGHPLSLSTRLGLVCALAEADELSDAHDCLLQLAVDLEESSNPSAPLMSLIGEYGRIRETEASLRRLAAALADWNSSSRGLAIVSQWLERLRPPLADQRG